MNKNQMFGIFIFAITTIAILAQRFSHPDMTQVRWFIEYWHVWLLWFACSILAVKIYSKK